MSRATGGGHRAPAHHGDAPRAVDARVDLDPAAGADLRGAGRFGGLSALGLLGVVVGAVPFLSLTALVLLEWEPLARWDEDLSQGLNDSLATEPGAVRVLRIVTELGGGAPAGALMGLAVIWLLVRRHHQLAAYVAVTGLGLAALIPLSKELVGRERPDVALPVAHLPTNPSFPSGHAMTAMVTWGALTLVALPVVRAARRRWLVAATVGFVLLTGFTRVALGVHFPSDVIAGWALGGAWLAVTALAFRSWLAHRHLPRGEAGLTEAPVRALHVTTLRERALPHGRRTVGRILALAALVTAVTAGVGLLVTGPLSGTVVGEVDQTGVAFLVEARSPQLTRAVDAAATVGDLWGVVIAGTSVAALGVAVRGSWRPAVLVVVAVAGEVALYGLVSYVVSRRRPDVENLYDGLPEAAAFPSGHVAATVAVYGSLSALVLVYVRRWWRWLVVAAAVALTAVVMVARVYVAAHHPSDVVGGVLLAGLWVGGLAALLLPRGHGPPPDHRWHTPLRDRVADA